MIISIAPHPLLDTIVFHTMWPKPLDDLATLGDIAHWFSKDAAPPFERPDTVKPTVRDLLRHGGFKPSGRSKPASEYLVSAVAKEKMGSINPAVDCCNVASLYSGLPISVVDLHKGTGPWRLGVAEVGSRYVFNPSGQEIDIGGLISLFDARGPCGGPVKDSQRTKTHPGTTETISVIWGTQGLEGRTALTADWYASLMRSIGGVVDEIKTTAPTDQPG